MPRPSGRSGTPADLLPLDRDRRGVARHGQPGPMPEFAGRAATRRDQAVSVGAMKHAGQQKILRAGAPFSTPTVPLSSQRRGWADRCPANAQHGAAGGERGRARRGGSPACPIILPRPNHGLGLAQHGMHDLGARGTQRRGVQRHDSHPVRRAHCPRGPGGIGDLAQNAVFLKAASVALSIGTRPWVSASTRRISQRPAPWSCRRGEVMTVQIEASVCPQGNHVAEPTIRPFASRAGQGHSGPPETAYPAGCRHSVPRIAGGRHGPAFGGSGTAMRRRPKDTESFYCETRPRKSNIRAPAVAAAEKGRER